MNFYTEEKRILKEALDSGKLLLFIGAGASVASGMPLWKDALKPFYKGIGLNEDANYDNLKIPQMYYNARGLKEYVDLARKTFRYGENLVPNKLHDCIMDMNVKQIITTNYDHLLEEAALKHNRIYQVISKDEDIPYASGNRRIIKMHGDFENGNFVLKEDDYLNYSTNYGMIETYCKSAIASNVVLFIGYSFNDPDVKQIFNWIKMTLKNNFQRAYLIDAINDYAEHDVQYFRNRGINILYASKEVSGFKTKSVTDRTTEMLRSFFYEKEEKKSLINNLYDKLNEQEFLTYIPRKYVISALRECGLYVIEGKIVVHKDEKKYIKDLKKISDVSTDEMVHLLQKAFVDCEIEEIVIEEEHKWKTISFKFDVGLLNSYLENYLNKFDYVGLKHYIKKLECLSLEDNLKKKQELVYAYYEVNEYEKAFGLSKQISMAYYRKGDFANYFISEYNRRRLAQMMAGPFGNGSMQEFLSGECSEKRLEEIVTEMTYSQVKTYKFLNDLLRDNYKEKYYEESLDLNAKIKKQAETNYSFFSGEPAVEQMRKLQRDFYNCQIKNLILGDCFRESMRIFKLGSRSLLESMAKGKTVNSDLEFRMDTTENIVLDELVPEDIFYLVKYMGKTDLQKVLSECKIKKIKVNDDVMVYICEILKNILEYMNKYGERKRWIEEEINILGLLLSKMDVSKELQVIYLQTIIRAMQMELLEDDANIVNNCILNFIGEDAFLELEELFSQILDILLKKAVKNLYYIDHAGKYLFRNVIRILADKYQYKLVEIGLEQFMKEKTDAILPQLYLICNEDERIQIREYLYSKWDAKERFDLVLYANALMENVIEPNEEYEKLAYIELENAKKNPGKVVPNHLTVSMNNMVTLYLNDKLLDKEQQKEIMLKSDRMQWCFLADMDSFDYEQFRVEWLADFSPALCEEIAQSEKAKQEISAKIKKGWHENKISEKILDKFLNYFLD